MLFEIGITTAVLILNEEVVESLSTNLKNDIIQYNVTANSMFGEHDLNPFTTNLHHIDFLQIYLKCCGIESYNDWESNTKLKVTKSVPDSCCKVPVINCGVGAVNVLTENNFPSEEDIKSNIYLLGCKHQSKTFFRRNAVVMGVIVIGIFGIQVIAIILSWCLSEQMRDKTWWKYPYKKQPHHKRSCY